MKSPIVVEDPAGGSFSEYERLRLENVKRNQALIAALGIQNTKSELKAFRQGPKTHANKGVKKKETTLGTRRLRSSSRMCLPTENMLESDHHQRRTKPITSTVTLEDAKQSVSLATVSCQGSSHDKFLSQLEHIRDNATLSAFSNDLSSPFDVEPSKFSLKKSYVIQMVPERITSAAFLPINEHLVMTVGDKGGHVGFWNIGSNDPEIDSLYVYRPHKNFVSGICFDYSIKMFTCSYDETVKQLDVEASMFNLVYSSDKNEILSAICSVPGSPFVLSIAEGPGYMKLLDIREKRHSQCVHIHRMTINTIDMNMHSPWLMLTGSTDKTAKLWDIRKLKSAEDRVHQYTHQKAVQSAQFSPSAKELVTCSYDNTVALAKVSGKKLPRFIAHANKYAKGISPFRAIWGWDDKYVYIGNMKRTIDIISTSFEIECYWLSSVHMKSVPSRLAAHPLRSGLLAACSPTGEVFLWSQQSDPAVILESER